MPESGFTLNQIMQLNMNFHTHGSSSTELLKWIKSKKAVINPQNKEEECSKWAAIAALHHKEVGASSQEN